MIIQTTYENLQIGETARVYLEIDDLVNSSGQSEHLERIDKILIERLDNSHLEPDRPNQTVRNVLGPQSASVRLDSDDTTTNFHNYGNSNSARINFADGYFVHVISPSSIEGYYEIRDIPIEYYDSNNQPVGKELIISGIFSTITEEIVDFHIVDSNYLNVTSTPFENGSILFNNDEEFVEPVWKKDGFFFEDLNKNYDFGSISSFDTCTLEVTISGTTYSYPCGRIYNTELNINYSFFIIGFDEPSEYEQNSVLSWVVKDANGNTAINGALLSATGSNGVIQPFYYSPVKIDSFTNSNSETLYRYYYDWLIEDSPFNGEGTYLIYWYVRRQNTNIIYNEIFSKNYLVHNDFDLPETYTRKFNRENYHELLKTYLPFFYLDYQADDVIDETLRAFGESIYDFQLKADQFLNLIDPKRVKVSLLPYLSNLFSYNLKGNDIVSWRQQLVNIPKLLKRKGTMDGLTELLALMSTTVKSIVFYWQVKSLYLWTDYFFLTNNDTSTTESYDLGYEPIVQLTGASNTSDFSRFLIEYYSQEQSAWYNLSYNNTGTVINEFQNLIDLSLSDKKQKYNIYSKTINWNLNDITRNQVFVRYEDVGSIFYDSDFENNLVKYRIHIKSGDVKHGLYEFDQIDIDDTKTQSMYDVIKLRLRYIKDESALINEDENITIEKQIIFSIIQGSDELSSPLESYIDLNGSIVIEEEIIKSVTDLNGKIRGYNLSTATTGTFTPQSNDVLKIRYQYNYYPYEINSSSQDYLTNFDNYELCKDDYILSLPLADSRSPYDSLYSNSRLIPPVNYNIRLLPDSTCFVTPTNEIDEFSCLSEYEVCDLCSTRNPLEKPIVFGHIRTKFPWSENVYNMDEYDGSTRPSYEPCDIDEDFLDKCSCCWSSQFSISVEANKLSNKSLESIREAINEFKPFHSQLKTFSYTGSFTDYCNIDDLDYNFELKQKYEDTFLVSTFNPYQGNTNNRSSYYNFAEGTFSTESDDLKAGVVLRDSEGNFNQFGVGKRNDSIILPTLYNVARSRLVIESPIGSIHSGNTYNVGVISNKEIQLLDDTSITPGGETGDNTDNIPTTFPYSYEGPWSYIIYSRKFPFSIESSPNWPEDTSINVAITKSGKYVISTNVELLENGLELVSTKSNPINTYQVIIESGAQAGTYNILNAQPNSIVLSDYQYGDPFGSSVTFSITRGGVLIDGLSSITGTLGREEIYGNFTYSGSDDIMTEWDIDSNISYVCINNGDYYPIVETIPSSGSGTQVKFKNYSSGPTGSNRISIFEKRFSSSTGYITSSTNIIHTPASGAGSIDLYNLIHNSVESEDRINDFLIGLYLNGSWRYYGVTEIYSSDVNKIKLRGLAIDEVVTGQDLRVRIYELTSYKLGTVRPMISLGLYDTLEGTADSGSNATTLIDATSVFVNMRVEEGDIVYNITDDSWSIITSVTANTLGFSALVQNGVAGSAFSDGEQYRIIRRTLYDYNIFGNDPVSQYTQILNFDSYNHNGISYVLVGPYDGLIKESDLDDLQRRFGTYRTINSVEGSQFEINVSVGSEFNIIPSTFNVYVNDHLWKKVDYWTDPEEKPLQIGLQEFMVEQKSFHDAVVWFGDDFTGKAPQPGDWIRIDYNYNGFERDPNVPEYVNQKEKIYFEIYDVNTDSAQRIYLYS